MATTVHNLRCERLGEGDVRIDRATRWGNPYLISPGYDRDRVVDSFRDYLADRLRREEWQGGYEPLPLRAALRGLVGKRLFCWCAPLRCHGDVLAEYAEKIAAEEDAAALMDCEAQLMGAWDTEEAPGEFFAP